MVQRGDITHGKRRSQWFETAFSPLGKQGKLKKSQFVIAASSIEGFGERLFDLFDVEKRGYISIQELVGGILLIWQQHGKKRKNDICHWFAKYFEDKCTQDGNIHLSQFNNAFADNTFAQNLFDLLDTNEVGEIGIDEVMSSLDRLECSSADTKWYRWIEDRFSVSMKENRYISFENFKQALRLQKTFFAERFFSLFDDNGDGKIEMKELVRGLEMLTNGTATDKLTFLFRVYDLDGDGSLNEYEIRTVLNSCLEESKLKFDDQQVEELLEVFFEEINPEKESGITLEEFKHFLSKYPGVAENLSISAGQLLKPSPRVKRDMSSFIPKHLTWDYMRKNPFKMLFVTAYVLLNIALSIWVIVIRKDEGGWVILARFNGMCLNFNCVLILVLMMKGSLTWLRSTRVGKYFPVDQHIIFHKSVAVVIFVQCTLHFVGHLGRYVTSEPKLFEVWEYMFTVRTPEGWVGNAAGLTGVLLLVILVVMFILSQSFVRERGFFELFYFTHHLYILWWILLILHAPNFWKWFIGPGVIYFFERISRLKLFNIARFGETVITEGITLASKVTHLVIKRPPNFHYKPGDYVLVNIPKIAKYEWHPFTISSSPDLTDSIWLHIRGVGTWTKKLYEYYENQEKKECQKRSIKRGTIRRQKSNSIRNNERQNQQNIRQRYSKRFSMRGGGRLNSIAEDEGNIDHVDLVEIVVPETSQEQKDQNTLTKKMERFRHDNSELQIYVDGPYGAPATHFTEAEHAVLISSGIGVTPFASILQTIMLRYKNASHTCPSCEFSWIGNVPYSLRKLRKVDFIWINRDQNSFEWFLSLLNQLEMEQSEHEGVFSEHFLEIHIYMTSALRKEDMKALGLQLALELIHNKKEKDLITGLKTRTNPGRPDWEQVFENIDRQDHGKVSVFYCGNPALGKVLKKFCHTYGFGFREENF